MIKIDKKILLERLQLLKDDLKKGCTSYGVEFDDKAIRAMNIQINSIIDCLTGRK